MQTTNRNTTKSKPVYSPRGTRFDPQHVPGVLAVSDTSDGVGLLFGEADADLRHRTLPAVLTHVGDGREKRLRETTRTHDAPNCFFKIKPGVSFEFAYLKHLVDALSALRRRLKVMKPSGLRPQAPLPLVHHPPLRQVHLHRQTGDARFNFT